MIISVSNQRIRITKQLLRNGLLSCLQTTPLDKISISELCRVSGVNRATFYHHYELPKDILVEIGWEYAERIHSLFFENQEDSLRDNLIKCISYLHAQRDTLKTILSANADQYLAESITEIFSWFWNHFVDLRAIVSLDDDEYDIVVDSLGWSAYYFIRSLILNDIHKTPEETADLLSRLLLPLIKE